MFEKITEQFNLEKVTVGLRNFSKPINELNAINAKALEQITQQQTSLFTGFLNDGVAYAENVSNLNDLSGAVEFQKSYSEAVREKLIANAKDTYEVIVEAQEKTGEVFKSAFADVKESVQAVATPEAAKPAPAKPRARKAPAAK